MKKSTNLPRRIKLLYAFLFLSALFSEVNAQTLAFPGAQGFGRFALGARAAANPEVYIVTNLNDGGTGSFRDAVSKSGRIVVFAVGGIVNLQSNVVVAANVTIAGQTAPGDGIVFFNKRVTFSGASNAIARYLRIRLGATNNSGNDASGLSNGANMIFDHMSFSWAMDEVFSINWDNKGSSPDNITVQNSIIGQGLHRENHSAGGLIQTPDGGKVSLLRNLYISNKTRNPKVKGVNEFVNNVVYNWGNGGRLDQDFNYPWSGDAYIMGGSSGISEVNVINNYFVGGPLTPPGKTTPFSRGTGTFNIHGSGNYFDNNQNGVLDGSLVPFDSAGYPGITAEAFRNQPFAYPAAYPALSAAQAYQLIIDSVGASYPRRDQVDGLMVDEVRSKGTKGMYVYRETDLPFSNGGLGNVSGAPAPPDSDQDGMPDAWEDANGLNKNNKADAVAFSTSQPQYLNIEVYINSLTSQEPPAFVKAPTALTLTASSQELPVASSTINVKWADNSDNESHFVLERSADGITYTDIAHPAANTQTYTDNAGLIPNVTYYYRLKAVSASEQSVYSTVVSVKTPPIPSAPAVAASPVPASGFQYAAPAGGSLSLKWTGSANTISYAVFLGTDPAALTQVADVAYAASPSFLASGLTDNVTYYWRVDARNAKGTATGPVWSFRTAPVIPAGLVAHYAFDESADDGILIADSSSYNNDGVLGLDADNQGIRITGKLKNALDFSTANPSIYVVKIPNGDQLFLDKSSFSLSFWMKADASLLPADNNTSSYLLCKGSISRNAATGATGKRFDIEFKNKQIRFALDDDNDSGGGGKDELATSGTPFFTGKWVHVVAVRDVATKKLQLYMNGSLVTSTNITKSNSGIGEASALIIGNIGELEFLASTNKPAPYKGMLDEVRLYNYVLSSAEINALTQVKNTQSVTFAAFDNKTIGDPDFSLAASASSGLPVTFSSSDTSVAVVRDGIVHITGAGTTVLKALQAGNDMFNASEAVRELVVAPLLLKISYRDADNGQVQNNTIKPEFKIINEGNTAVAWKELTVRYWFTAENYSDIAAWIDYAQLGNNNVTSKYVSLAQPAQGALGYIEYSFKNLNTMLAALSNSGSIQSRFNNKDYAVFNESDDHSYKGGSAYSFNDRMTIYRNGVLIWGTEPGSVSPLVKLKVLAQNRNSNTSGNTISNTLQLNNEGNMPLAYEDLSVRYWFSSEGTSSLNAWIDYAKPGNNNMETSFVKIGSPAAGADTYFQLKVKPAAGTLYPMSSTGSIQFRVAKSDWSAFNESNDYSFKPAAPLAENMNITVYYKGQLIYGTEPGDTGAGFLAAARTEPLSMPENDFSAKTIAYPNPAVDKLYISLSKEAEAGALLNLYNMEGRLLSTQGLRGRTATLEMTGVPAGLYIIHLKSGNSLEKLKIRKN